MTRRKQQKKTGKSNKPKKQGRQNTVVHIENTNKKQQEIERHEAPEEIDAQEQPTGFYSVLVDEEGPQDDANEGTAEEGTTDTVEIAEEPNESDKGWEEIDCDKELEISLRPQTSLAASQCLPQQKPSIQIYDREFLLSFSTICTEKLPSMPSFASIYGYAPTRRTKSSYKKTSPRRAYHEQGERKPEHTVPSNHHEDWRPKQHSAQPSNTPELDKENDSPLANAWAPSRRRTKDNGELLLREVKGSLNKLTEQNYDSLSPKLLEAVSQSAAVLTAVVDFIFAMALQEPSFAPLYARLCHMLDAKCPQFPNNTAGASDNQDELTTITFKKALLDRCQKNFEERETREDASGDEEDAEKERKKTISNCIFIGELFKAAVLPDIVMHLCVKSLLGEATSTATTRRNSPEDSEEERRRGKMMERIDTDLEALCKLLSTIGRVFDKARDKQIEGYFTQIKKLSGDPTLPSRVRCRLLDVIDLRTKRWQQ